MSTIVTRCITCGQGFDANNNAVGTKLAPNACLGEHAGPFDFVGGETSSKPFKSQKTAIHTHNCVVFVVGGPSVIDFQTAEGKQTLDILRAAWKEDIREIVSQHVREIIANRSPSRSSGNLPIGAQGKEDAK
jgi:hypothetical protein